MTLNEITLHGTPEIMEKRIAVLTEEALKYRTTDPEKYLLLRNLAIQIYDQLIDAIGE